MRNCIRCQTQMVEGLEPMTNEGCGLSAKDKGIFKPSVGKLLAAACPNCGYLEIYLEAPEKLRKVIEKRIEDKK